ncbi:MAG: hypothetical protein KDC98_17355, partial [Planctomycetes bacterium]|nr:hypothetical protein [Planctomycetota bacterium]
LFAACVAAIVLGCRYRTPAIIEVGALTTAVAGIGMGYPAPLFPATAALLLLALVGAVGCLSARRHAWLQWPVAALLGFFWLLWTFKIAAVLGRGEPVPANLWQQWHAPVLLLTFAALIGLAYQRCRHAATPFWLTLPTVAVLALCAAAASVVDAWLGAPRLLGFLGTAIAAVLALLAWRLARANVTAAAVAGFAIAAATMLIPSARYVTGSGDAALLVAAVAGLSLAAWSTRVASAGMRVTGANLQVGVTVFAMALGTWSAPSASPLLTAALALVLAVVALLHFRIARRVPPAAGTWVVRVSPTDRPAIALLWCGVATLFAGVSVIAWPLLAACVTEIDAAFMATQSVLLNLIAVILLVLALRWHDRQLLGSAVLAAVIAGGKVFAVDMLQLQGVALVLSVFSFGLTAAAGSWILGRWRQGEVAAGESAAAQ